MKEPTFEQRRKYFELRRKRQQKSLNKIYKLFSKVAHTLYIFCFILIKVIIVALLGMGSKSIIYSLNEPLGMGYATFGSYAITGLLWSMIPNFWEKKK
jgi:hypothetical protein